jgi:hypothetical protein
MFLPFTTKHGDVVASSQAICIVHGSFLSCEFLHQHSSSSCFFSPFPLSSSMKPSLRSRLSQLHKQASLPLLSPSLPVCWLRLLYILKAPRSAFSAQLFWLLLFIWPYVWLLANTECLCRCSRGRRCGGGEISPRRPLSFSPGAPLVLQVSPLPGTSTPEKFFYNPFTDLKTGDFVAAHAFFIHHGHTVVYHDCPDAAAFWE